MFSRLQQLVGNRIASAVQASARAPRLCCWFLAMYCYAAVLVPILNQVANSSEGPVMGLFVGVVIGQCIVIAILGALYGTSWIDGFFASGVAVVVGMLITITGGTIAEGRPPGDFWAIFGFVPGLMFAVYAPLLVMRHLANWRLVDPKRVYAKQPADLTSIFLNTAAVAVILMALRVPQSVYQMSATQFWLPTVVTGIVLILVSCVVTLPIAAFVLNCDDPKLRVIRIGGAGLLASVVFALCMTVIGLAFEEPMPLEFYLGATFGTVGALVVTYFGIWAIRHDGFRLRTKTNGLGIRKTPGDETDVGDEQIYLAGHRKRLFARVTAMVIVMIVVNAYLGRVHSREANFARAMAALRELVEPIGGRLEIRKDSTFGIVLGDPRDGTPSGHANFVGYIADLLNTIRRYHISNDLVSVDMSSLPEDPFGLGVWGAFPNLQALDISNSSLTRDLSNLRQVSLEELVAKNTDLTRTTWSLFKQDRLKTLVIDGSRIDANSEFVEVLRNGKLERLSMNDVEVVGEPRTLWQRIPAPDPFHLLHLSMAGTSISDDFIALLKSHRLKSLDLSRTQITDASIDAIVRCASRPMILRLSGTKLTDAGFARLKPVRFAILDLSETSVSDAAFQQWIYLPTKRLDLSNTEVGDGLGEYLLRPATPTTNELEINLSGDTDY